MKKQELKVCMIVFNHFTNDARVLKEANTLINNGYKVKVFALNNKVLPQFESINSLEIERVYTPSIKDFLLKKKSTDNNFPTNVKTQKQPLDNIISSFFLGIYRPLTYFIFHRKVSEKISKEKFDIFHAHDLNTLYPAYKSAKKQKAKLIYDSHELYVERNKPRKPSPLYKWLSKRFESYLIKRANAVITVGKHLAQHLQNQYDIPLPNVIMNAPSQKIELADKNLRNELEISNDHKIAIYCGSITFNRGLEKLIESLPLSENIHLIYMGYGKPSYLNRLKKIAKIHKVEDRFSFFGPVPSNEVTSYTASADIGIAPIQNACLSYYYCAPNKIFEYLIGGIPVIASNFPELSDIVTKNKIGLTFDPESTESIANAIKGIFSEEIEFNKMKENTKIAAQKYNWENESKKLLDVYDSIK